MFENFVEPENIRAARWHLRQADDGVVLEVEDTCNVPPADWDMYLAQIVVLYCAARADKEVGAAIGTAVAAACSQAKTGRVTVLTDKHNAITLDAARPDFFHVAQRVTIDMEGDEVIVPAADFTDAALAVAYADLDAQ
jgi:hypothetical protein